jgi:hypothetical protein
MVVAKAFWTDLVTRNFTHRELFSKCEGAKTLLGHYLSDNTVNALQRIRDEVGYALSVTSTLRMKDCNEKEGGGETSKHLTGNAIDFQPTDPKNRSAFIKWWADVVFNKTAFYYELVNKFGLKGFGVYDTFAHIDDGQRGSVTTWDNRKIGNKDGFITGIINSVKNTEEDGYSDITKKDVAIVVLIGVVFVSIAIFVFIKIRS